MMRCVAHHIQTRHVMFWCVMWIECERDWDLRALMYEKIFSEHDWMSVLQWYNMILLNNVCSWQKKKISHIHTIYKYTHPIWHNRMRDRTNQTETWRQKEELIIRITFSTVECFKATYFLLFGCGGDEGGGREKERKRKKRYEIR